MPIRRKRYLLVTITETTKLLLTGSIPSVEADTAEIGIEDNWMYFNTNGGNVLLLELARQMAFNEGGLARATVTDQNQLECWDS
jgi:hypothetical protein